MHTILQKFDKKLAKLCPKLYGRGRKESSVKRVTVRKTLIESMQCYDLHDANHVYSNNITSKT